MRRLPLQFATLGRFLKSLRLRLKARNRRRFAADLSPLTFRQLENRRVLSVTSGLNAGLLTIAITDNSTAGLLVSGADLFVDENADAIRDPGEFTRPLNTFSSLQVTDNGAGSFFWGNTFNVLSANVQVGNATFGGTINVANNLTLNVQGNVQFTGAMSVSGDLTVGANTQQLSNTDGASLNVTGHAQLNALSIDLGQRNADSISFGSVSFNNPNANVTLDESSLGTAGTSLTGVNNLTSLTLRSDGPIELAAAASLTSPGNISLDANGVDADVQLNGSMSSGAGQVTVTADDRIVMGTDAQISTTTGDVLLRANADALDGNDNDGITMNDGSSIVVGNARIDLNTTGASGGSIALGRLVSTSNLADAIEVDSQQSILDNTTDDPTNAANDPDLNITAVNGTAVLRALQGIGAGNDIDIDVANVVFNSGASIALTDTRGGLTISAASTATGGGSISANSPLTISANVTVGASTSFTAGDSNLAGDHLTIDSGAVVTLNSVAAATLTFNAGDDIVFNTGRIETTGNVLHQVILAADLDHAGVGAADGDRGSISQGGGVVTEVTTGRLTATAAAGIDLDTNIDTLVANTTDIGNITVDDQGNLLLENVTTTNGSVAITSTGTLTGTLVNAVGATSDVNLSGVTGIIATNVTGARNVSLTSTAGDITSGSVTATAGTLGVSATAGSVTVGSMVAGSSATLTAAGTIRGTSDDAVADLRAGTTIQLNAGTGISGPGGVGRLDLFGGSLVSASTTTGNIALDGLDALTLTNVSTGNGSINVRAVGLLTAISVNTTNTDNDANDITLESTTNSVALRSVLAGPTAGDVTVIAANSILDDDSLPDDVDVSGNTVILTATTGSIGSTSSDIFTGSVAPLEVTATGNLTATALAGLIALDPTVTGMITLNSPTAWLQSNGDLNVSAQVFTVQNLALVADADLNGTGTLTIAPVLNLVGDLRVEGANVEAAGPIDLSANRLMFVSGRTGVLPLQNESIIIRARQFDGTTSGNLTVESILPAPQTLELIDLNRDNMALRTLSGTGSIDLRANSTIIVSDDIIAGNDNLATSTGTVRLRAINASSDIFVNDVILTDGGNIDLLADNDIRFGTTPTGNEPTTDDDLSIVTSIDGVITLRA
ncbi:MAG: hypothetical protein IT423_19355, partial [Pirellulaceae bacterium]|nr:hypothetical protein [Pirellulaceae bacterium]